MKVVKPINVTQLTASSVSYDLGNNYAGVPRVTLPAGVPAGHQMTIAVTEYPAEAGASYPSPSGVGAAAGSGGPRRRFCGRP